MVIIPALKYIFFCVIISLIDLFITITALSQTGPKKANTNDNTVIKPAVFSVPDWNLDLKITANENDKKDIMDDNSRIPREYSGNMRDFIKKQEKIYKFDIISSFRENIRFGGFWDKYAIINFTPSFDVEPDESFRVFGNKNLSCFVPVRYSKDYIKNFALYSSALIAVDNTINFIFKNYDILSQLINFSAKYLLVTLLKNSISSRLSSDGYIYDNNYLAVRIRF